MNIDQALGDAPAQELSAFIERQHGVRIDPKFIPLFRACGGELAEVPKEQVRDRVPPRSFAWLERFWECNRCRQVFWHRTH